MNALATTQIAGFEYKPRDLILDPPFSTQKNLLATSLNIFELFIIRMSILIGLLHAFDFVSDRSSLVAIVS